jgi:lipopolysaccharide biosynthesis regulator YciM
VTDFDIQWLLLGLPVAFALGWLASRWDLRQFRGDSRDAPRATFKGLNLLLNEQQDAAIDAFIEAAQNDLDSAELHFALGNLFRRRGDFDRAVRVHQHLLQRGDLKASDRERAQLALAQDYQKAGLFDRAEEAWLALLGTSHDADAQFALLALYERSHDWARASRSALALEQAGRGDFSQRRAHHHCELCEEADARGDAAAGDAELALARDAAPQAARVQVLEGRRFAARAQPLQAMQAWDRLHANHAAVFNLVAQDYARASIAAGRAEQARQVLAERFDGRGRVDEPPGIHVAGRQRSPHAHDGRPRGFFVAPVPLRGLRLRGPAPLLAMPGVPELGELSAAADG